METDSSPRPAFEPTVEVGLDDFAIHGLVGEGQFGQVMMTTQKSTGALFAMKVIRKEQLLLQGRQSVTQAITENQVLQQMSARPHPYIVSLMFAFQDEERLYLVMDYVGGGDLFSLLEQRGRMPETWVRVYAGEIVLALGHVHEHGIIFRDLKPENVMVGMDGHLKLTDFGMSKRLESGPMSSTATICGTPEYIAPEVMSGLKYDASVDWWTLGCLVYEMLVGDSPFRSEDITSVVHAITRKKVDVPSSVSVPARTLIDGLLEKDPKCRLGSVGERWCVESSRSSQQAEGSGLLPPPPTRGKGSAAVKAHQFFSGLNWEDLFAKKVPAPTTPALRSSETSDRGAPFQMKHARGIEQLKTQFTTWATPASLCNSSASPTRNVTRDARATTQDSTSFSSLVSKTLQVELTADGTVWSISQPMLRLLGAGRAAQQLVIGLNIFNDEQSFLDPLDRKSFESVFYESVNRLVDEPDESPESSSTIGHNSFDTCASNSPLSPSSPVVRPSGLSSSSSVHQRKCETGVSRDPTTSPPRISLPSSGAKLPFAAAPLAATPVAATLATDPAASAATLAGAPHKYCCRPASASSASSTAFFNSLNGSPALCRQSSDRVSPISKPPARLLSAAGEGETQVKVSLKDISPIHRRSGADLPLSETLVRMKTFDNRRLWVMCMLDTLVEQEGNSTLSQARVIVVMRDVTQIEENKELVRKRYDWSYNSKRRDEELETLFSSSMEYHKSGTQAPQSEEVSNSPSASGIVRYLDRRRLFCLAFPDINFEILEQTCKGQEEVITSFQWNATHTGPYHTKLFDGSYGDLPASGQRVRVHGVAIDTIRAQKIVSHAAYYDETALRMQLQNKPSNEKVQLRAWQRSQAIIRVQLTLRIGTRWKDGVFTKLSARLRVAPEVPIKSAHEAMMQDEMQRFYAIKYLRHLALFEGDGFCLCEAAPGLPIMLCTNGFVEIVQDEGNQVVQSGLIDILRTLQFEETIEDSPPNEPPNQRRETDARHESPANQQHANSSTMCNSPTNAKGLLAAIERAVGAKESLQEVFTGRDRRGAFFAILMNLTPVMYDRKVYYAVLMLDLDWPNQHSYHQRPKLGVQPIESLVWHRLPLSWLWFEGKPLQSVLISALHAMDMMFTLVDMSAEDQPMVWLNRGFDRITGYMREEVVGTNCRFLQGEQTDPMAVAQLRQALEGGRGVRVHMYNRGHKQGFWNLLSLHPVVDVSGEVRYYCGLGARLSREQLNQIVLIQSRKPIKNVDLNEVS
mmetsp:Transcript_7389/g.12446  ORF Transcript_7389/g.12446 Transcript_7389/m.12446 type:complete len:1256 (-) Transcript_7389:302-4069(-)